MKNSNLGIDQLSVFIENKPGKLVDVLEAIGKIGVDLRALCLADTSDFGVLRVIVDRPDDAYRELAEMGYLVKVNKVLPVAISDEPGSLARTLRILKDRDISVEYTYAFVAHSTDRAYVIIRVEDNDEAVKALAESGVGLAKESEIYNL
ncbi:MAG: hypothetical protein GX823_07075 [Clostridiales bacterium]|nr:hypothetical protein [Clostridiales bacterium]